MKKHKHRGHETRRKLVGLPVFGACNWKIRYAENHCKCGATQREVVRVGGVGDLQIQEILVKDYWKEPLQ